MGENMTELKKQVRKVIKLLRQRIAKDPDKPVLKTLYNRYMKAMQILINNGDIDKITISGGCEAYLDAFSDYTDPLLAEMDIAEKMLECKKT